MSIVEKDMTPFKDAIKLAITPCIQDLKREEECVEQVIAGLIAAGYAIVPHTATEVQIEAAYKANDDWPASDWGKSVPAPFEEIWRAMIEAAPR